MRLGHFLSTVSFSSSDKVTIIHSFLGGGMASTEDGCIIKSLFHFKPILGFVQTKPRFRFNNYEVIVFNEDAYSLIMNTRVGFNEHTYSFAMSTRIHLQ